VPVSWRGRHHRATAVLPALPERALRGDAGDRTGTFDDAAIAGAAVMLRGASMFLFHPQADGSFVVQGGARFMPANPPCAASMTHSSTAIPCFLAQIWHRSAPQQTGWTMTND